MMRKKSLKTKTVLVAALTVAMAGNFVSGYPVIAARALTEVEEIATNVEDMTDVMQEDFFTEGILTDTKVRYPRVMEYLDRGLIAIPKNYGEETKGMYLSWRLLGTESLADTRFDIYKNGTLLVEDYDGTNYTDVSNENGADTTAVYQVVPADTELTEDILPANTILVKGEQVTITITGESENNRASLSNCYGYFDIPLNIPAQVTDELAGTYTYSANDCSVGDVDGDGQYEIIVKWEPSNAQDNSKSGYTGEVLLSCYEFDGTELWEQPIHLGPNIRAGAHYTQFMVYDFDGDGYAEMILKTAPGSRDGKGNYVSEVGATTEIKEADNTTDYRESSGHLLSGPEYLTVFEGATGAALYTTNYEPTYGEAGYWGDKYGNRGNRFLAAVGYFGNQDTVGNLLPSVVMCRGYYTQSYLAAYDWDGEKLTQRFYYKGESADANSLYGQGNHNLMVSDVDNDGYDEIVYGSGVLDHDGTMLCSTGLGHGDALHVNDFNNDGEMEVFQVHESSVGTAEYAGDFWKAATGEHIFGLPAFGDTGRGVMANVDDAYAAANPSSLAIGWTSSHANAYDTQGKELLARPSSSSRSQINSLVYWDGDLSRELLDDNQLAKYNAASGSTPRFYFGKNSYASISTNNSSKYNANITADLFGDWREEIIGRGNNSLRVYLSSMSSEYKLTTLMHDSQYRLGVATENVAYNIPPHTSYYVGSAALAAEDANYLAPAYAYTKMITTKDGELTPTITIQIGDVSRAYGEENPDFTFTYDEEALSAQDTIEKWNLSFSTEATCTSPVGTYEITATYTDVEGYRTVIEAGTLTITKAEAAPNMPEKTMTVPYEKKEVTQIILPEGWSWKLEDAEKDLYAGEVITATAEYICADASNYKDIDVIVAITREENVFSFTDVDLEGWEYKGIYYSYQCELMSGKSETMFAPRENLSRAQFVTVLHSHANKPLQEFEDKFTDVKDGEWYSAPIVWAVNQGITSGYPNGTFGVKDNITREQFVTMLYSYAKSIGFVTEVPSGELAGYEDAALVEDWAVESMLWATQNEMISGKPKADGTGKLLDPEGNTTRAECATIMMQFDKKVRGAE